MVSEMENGSHSFEIHKHSKGDKACKGSDKVVMKPNPPKSSEKF